MEEKESTALNSEEKLEEYIEKRRKELLYLGNSISFCDLIDSFKYSGYTDDIMLGNIANHPRGIEIKDDAFYVIHNHELNFERFARVKNALEIDAALNRIKESVLFVSNDETRNSLESQLLNVKELVLKYEKYISGEDILGIIDVIEKSNLSADDKLEILKKVSIESSERLEKRKSTLVAQQALVTQHKEPSVEQSASVEKMIEVEQPLTKVEEPQIEQPLQIDKELDMESPESIMNRALNYYEMNKYIIENDDEEAKGMRKSLSMLLNHLNTPDCEGYSFENKIGIVLYILKSSLNDYEEAEQLNDTELKRLIANETLNSLRIGEILYEGFEAKKQETQEAPFSYSFEDTMFALLQNNIFFLRDKTDIPIIQSSIETFAPSEKEKIINIIKRIQTIPSDVGSKPLVDKWKHSIYAKETAGFSVSYLRLPNESLLVLDVSRDKEAIFKDAKKIDMDYEKKIEEIISEAGTNRTELFKREEDKLKPKKEDKGHGGKI